MSAEFEKIVLEKFDELKTEINNLSEKVENNTTLINNISQKVENNTTLINNISQKVENNTALINNISKKVENNTALINNISKKVENNTALINNISKDVHDTQGILKIQGQNLAHFEHECMLKLNTLFDSFVANSEGHAVFSKFIAQLNAESFDYGQRISKLEEYFRNSKILSTN